MPNRLCNIYTEMYQYLSIPLSHAKVFKNELVYQKLPKKRIIFFDFIYTLTR